MILTQFDKPLTAEEARKISLSNREESTDRIRFREIMHGIRESASWGHTRYFMYAAVIDRMPSDHVQAILKSMGYNVVVKRAYLWDEKEKKWSDKPYLSHDGREQFVAEITWG
jgi:hypothetical protein